MNPLRTVGAWEGASQWRNRLPYRGVGRVPVTEGLVLDRRKRMYDNAAHWLPPGYVLDILDPDVVILRREDGSMVGAFSLRGATPESIRHTAEEDKQKRRDPFPRRGPSPPPAA